MRRRALIATSAVGALVGACALGFWVHACLRRGKCSFSVADGGSALASAMLVVGGAMVVLIASRAAWMLFRAANGAAALPGCPWSSALAQSIGRTGAERVTCLRDDDALAFTAGGARPRLYLTDTLVDCLRPDELDSVLVHERAHARRRDPLRQALRRASADIVFFLPLLEWWGRRQSHRAELAADRGAITAVSRRALAGALWMVGGGEGRRGSGFGTAGEARVAQLLGGRVPRCQPRSDEVLRSVAGAAVAGAVVLCVAPLFAG